ncbi:Variable outer membrane protein [Borrelia duttonii CR2A]|uniref:Variable large protein n=1 Tax=Borrelia duttonii CR2A TaxID=1432657 RepID=W6TGK6_9SPIR|nr:Variable outer membrane protein [Borrelia duttonii CR2A]
MGWYSRKMREVQRLLRLQLMSKKTIGKLFGGKDNSTDVIASAASESIGAVSGSDILQAITQSSEVAGEVDIDKAKNSAEIAASKKDGNKEIKDGAQKDAVIAGGIALRGMVQEGVSLRLRVKIKQQMQ